MALEYVVTKRVFGFDDTKTEKYVAKSVRSGPVSYTHLSFYEYTLSFFPDRKPIINTFESSFFHILAHGIGFGR